MAAVLSRIQETQKKQQVLQDSSQNLLTYLAEIEKIPHLRTLSDVLRQWFGCSFLAVGSGQQGGRVRLKSVTDVVKVDPKTSQARLYTKVMQDCLQQNKTIAWPVGLA